MRSADRVVVVVLAIAGCGDPSVIELEEGVRREVGSECAMEADLVMSDDEVALLYSCSGVTDGNWWVDKGVVGAASLHVGDCVVLKEDAYCLEEATRRESARFRRRYSADPSGLLRRIDE